MFANQRFFDAPGAMMIAAGKGSYRGPNSPIYGADGSIAGYATNGGIERPKRYEIPHNSRLIRFGRNIHAELVLQGDWWLEEKEFLKIAAFAGDRKIGVCAALRMLCAVPSEWSTLDLMVQAITTGPLLAYRGPGNSAVIPASNGQVAQPGVNDTGLLDAWGRPAGQVRGARPAKLAQAPAYAKVEYIPPLPDTNGVRIQQLFIPGLGSADVRRASLLYQGRRVFAQADAQMGYAPFYL